jgi:YegS/Rv2252/BmrU family lipid kinase
MQKRQILFIINPISGVYKKEGIPEKIAKYIDFTQFDYTIRTTQYAGHATEIAAAAVKEGFNIIVAVGGDGSINEVANALIGTEAVLGIIPFGSGNGLARHFKMKPRNAKSALEVINHGKVVKMDVIKSNIKYFFSCAGFGYDAHAARRFRAQPLRGFFSYFLAGAREIFWYFKPSLAKVEIDGEVFEQETYLFTAFNANQYGYEFGILPNTSVKDGLMDIVLLRSFPLRRLFYIFFCLVLKRPDLVKEASVFRAKKVKFYGNKKNVYQFDGDHIVYHDDIEMEVEPLALNVLIPESSITY